MRDIGLDLAIMKPENLLKRIESLERKLTSLQNSSIKINTLDELTDNLGVQRAGGFLATNSESGEPDDGTYTGCFMSADGYSIGGSIYNIGGLNNGTLQWGAENTGGAILAGAGAVTLDKNGITLLLQDNSEYTNSMIKWKLGGTVSTLFRTYYNLTTIVSDIQANGMDTIENASITMKAECYNSDGYGAYLYLNDNTPGYDSIANLVANTISLKNAGLANCESIELLADDVQIGGDSSATLNTNGVVYSGTYTPTLTNSTNIASSTVYPCSYIRVGQEVIVKGRVVAAAGTVGTGALFFMQIPIVSNFTETYQCSGVFHTDIQVGGQIYGDTSLDKAAFLFSPIGTTSNSYRFMFMYSLV